MVRTNKKGALFQRPFFVLLSARHCERSVAIFDRKVGDKLIEDCHVAIAPRNDAYFLINHDL